jgi:hypothetical protein
MRMSGAARQKQREAARERKRNQRAVNAALDEAGLIRLKDVIVPVALGDYLRATGHMPLGSEDDADEIAEGLARLIDTLLAASR